MSVKWKIARFLSRSILGYEFNVLTFSQAGEDLVIRNFFYERVKNGKPGFFVDVGAYHPYQHSNTYYLYRAGWRGINIDARPNSMEVFRKLRPEDINLEMAISEREGTSTYYDFGESAAVINTMSSDYIDKLGNEAAIKNTYLLKTASLASVLEKYVPAGTQIDFLSIDIEGLEYPALSSNDWSKFRPKLIACEIYGYSLEEISADSVSRLLSSNGYQIHARVILETPKVNTVFFVNSE